MVSASGSRMQIAIAEQSVFGTAVTANGKFLRFTSESLAPTIETVVSQEVRADRQTTDLVQTGRGAAGSISTELSYEWVDRKTTTVWSLLEGAMMSADFTAEVETGPISTTTTLGTTISGTGIGTGMAVGEWVQFGTGFHATDIGKVARILTVSANEIVIELYTLQNLGPVSMTIASLGYIDNGTTDKYYTIEKDFDDIDEAEQYDSMAVDTMSIETAANAIITATFGFLGDIVTRATTPSFTAIQAQGTQPIMNAISNATVRIAGTDSTIVQSFTLNTANNLRTREVIGTLGAQSISAGQFNVSGSFQALFEAADTEYAKLLAQTSSNLVLILLDANNAGYVIDMPEVKYSGGSLQNPGINQDVPVALDFSAIRDTTLGYTMRISRTADLA